MFARVPSLGFLILLGSSVAAAAAPIPAVCQAAVDARIKVITVPHHTVSTEGSPPEVGEAITADGVSYIKYQGKWMKSPMTVQQSVDQLRENIKNARAFNCTRLSDGEVDGTPATVYKVHYDMPNVGSSDAQIWIAKSTGLPLRTEEDFDTGTKRHMSIKFDYVNIKTPVIK